MAESARRGYLDGQALAGVFAWLRPNDLVWNYVVNNYLLGSKPPAFDVLYWNQDAVRLAAGLHRDFVRLALDNSLARPGRWRCSARRSTSAGRRRQLHRRRAQGPHRAVAERVRSTQLLGGEKRFVLSTSGHIQALVNPPAPDSRASYRVAGEHPADPRSSSTRRPSCPEAGGPTTSSGWQQRSGELRPAPKKLGGAGTARSARRPAPTSWRADR